MKGKSELEELKDLCERVAAHLSGRPVRVRFQKPIYVGSFGTAQKSTGVGVIDLDPAAPLAEQFKAFVHECAHLVNDWDELSDYTYLAPSSIDTTQASRAEMKAAPMEKPARALAFEWMNFADYHRFKYSHFGGEIVPRLAALLEWKPQIKEPR